MDRLTLARDMGSGLRPTIPVLLLFLAWLAIPLACAALYGFVQSRWVLQDTPRLFLAMASVGGAWFLVAFVPLQYVLHVRLTAKIVVALLAWSALGGAGVGPMGLNLLNCMGDGSPGVSTELEHTGERLRMLVRLRAVSPPDGGATFTFKNVKLPSLEKHGEAGRVRYSAKIHRGRLGLWWADLTERAR